MAFSAVKRIGARVANMSGYPSALQAVINASPTKHSMDIAESASVARGVDLIGTISLGENTEILSDSVLRGNITVSDGARIGLGSKLSGDITIGKSTNFVKEVEAIGDGIRIGKYNAIARYTTFQNRNHLMHKPGIQW
ncbi:MAG TPA: hypothetical protein VFJ06_11810 [Halococcus sp.]|nr:hypothetical protein [Halococcus sp.]